MKALFCHDGPTYIDNDGNYYACVLTDEIIDRYFYLCDELIAINRFRIIEPNLSYIPITNKNIKFVEAPDVTSIKGMSKRGVAQKIVEQEIRKCDFVIARLPGFIGSYGVKFAKKYNKPYIIEMVGCPFNALWHHSLRGKLLAPFMYLYTKSILKNSTNIIYVTNEFLQKKYPTNGKQLGCSDVDIIIEKKVLEDRINKIKYMNENVCKLGTIGTLNMKYKGFDTVIKAISKLNKGKNKKYYYNIIGTGNKEWLTGVIKKYKVENYVKIYDALPHDKLIEWIDKNVDIYIQPSKTEGMPRATIETMSRACPIIGSDAGGIPELLENEYVFKKSDVKQLIKKISQFDKLEMEKQATRNFNEAKKYEKFKLEITKKEFYNEFIKENFGGKKFD